MPTELTLHGKRIASVFELLGRKENDLTYSLGWALAQSPTLRAAVLQEACGAHRCDDEVSVLLQERVRDGGLTDIELLGPTTHVIIEAKRGWALPSERQLSLYAPRLDRERRKRRALVAMSECSDEFAKLHLPARIGNTTVRHMSWQRVQRLARVKASAHAEKRLLAQLRSYFERVVKMQDQESNLVYVVSLGAGRPSWSKLTWLEIVRDRRRYFHPVGDGWPKAPPNYLAFRHGGRLQSIHHVEEAKVITEVRKEMPELNPGKWKPHFLYRLGPPIVPHREVRSGPIRNARRWVMLDLLLTSNTIKEAAALTKERRKLVE